ncbi:unnamed protein product [Rhodiola kirilowii]
MYATSSCRNDRLYPANTRKPGTHRPTKTTRIKPSYPSQSGETYNNCKTVKKPVQKDRNRNQLTIPARSTTGGQPHIQPETQPTSHVPPPVQPSPAASTRHPKHVHHDTARNYQIRHKADQKKTPKGPKSTTPLPKSPPQHPIDPTYVAPTRRAGPSQPQQSRTEPSHPQQNRAAEWR